MLTILTIVLSNPERRRHYDKYGTVADDEDDEAEFFAEFENMMFGGGMFGGGDDVDDFMEFLSSDSKYMRKMFRDLGKGARVGARGGKRGKKGQSGPDMDDLLTMFMMPGMAMGMGMGMGMKMPKKK